MPGSRLVNRNVVGENGRTSMRLEPELWDALREICRRENTDVGKMVRRVEVQCRTQSGGGERNEGGRTSAIRVFIVQYFRAIAEGKPQDSGKAAPCRTEPGYENRVI